MVVVVIVIIIIIIIIVVVVVIFHPHLCTLHSHILFVCFSLW